MLKEILLQNKDINGGFQERLNTDMPPKTLPPVIQHIIAGYILPFYAFFMLRHSKTMPFALENKLNEETKEIKENHEYEYGERLFKALLASCEQRGISIEVI